MGCKPKQDTNRTLPQPCHKGMIMVQRRCHWRCCRCHCCCTIHRNSLVRTSLRSVFLCAVLAVLCCAVLCHVWFCIMFRCTRGTAQDTVVIIAESSLRYHTYLIEASCKRPDAWLVRRRCDKLDMHRLDQFFQHASVSLASLSAFLFHRLVMYDSPCNHTKW